MSGDGAHALPEAQRRYTQVLCDEVEMSSARPDQGVESEPLSGPGSGAKLLGPHFICPNAINHMISLSCRRCWETPSLAGPIAAALDSTRLVYDVLSPGLASQFLWNEKNSTGDVA